MMRLKPFGAMVILLLLISCASKTIYIENNYRKPHSSFDSNKKVCGLSDQCIFKIQSIEDGRRNKENSGRIFGDLISGKGVTELLRNAFLSLNACGLTLISQDGADTPGREMIDLSIQLKLAYAHALSTSTSTNLVLNITYKHKENVLQSKMYRGTYTGINWWGTEYETNDSFKRALEKILDEASCDMHTLCGKL